jgi:GNAT superfamily N-acetyltransferase
VNRLRLLAPRDVPALGRFLEDALWHAPSAVYLPEELGPDFEGVAETLREATRHGAELCFVVPDPGAGSILALARVVPREFLRAAHIGTLELLVSPAWRRRGLGGKVLRALLAHPAIRARFLRLELASARSDAGLMALLGASPGWEVARVEIDGVRLDGRFGDAVVWVSDVPAESP